MLGCPDQPTTPGFPLDIHFSLPPHLNPHPTPQASPQPNPNAAGGTSGPHRPRFLFGSRRPGDLSMPSLLRVPKRRFLALGRRCHRGLVCLVSLATVLPDSRTSSWCHLLNKMEGSSHMPNSYAFVSSTHLSEPSCFSGTAEQGTLNGSGRLRSVLPDLHTPLVEHLPRAPQRRATYTTNLHMPRRRPSSSPPAPPGVPTRSPPQPMTPFHHHDKSHLFPKIISLDLPFCNDPSSPHHNPYQLQPSMASRPPRHHCSRWSGLLGSVDRSWVKKIHAAFPMAHPQRGVRLPLAERHSAHVAWLLACFSQSTQFCFSGPSISARISCLSPHRAAESEERLSWSFADS